MARTMSPSWLCLSPPANEPFRLNESVAQSLHLKKGWLIIDKNAIKSIKWNIEMNKFNKKIDFVVLIVDNVFGVVYFLSLETN